MSVSRSSIFGIAKEIVDWRIKVKRKALKRRSKNVFIGITLKVKAKEKNGALSQR
tara:strand:+ start:151 stop:315 length:165 start_codon:yes stop_codon:yes gene_type:complete